METATSHEELRQLEQELNIEILPGTEVMTDVGSHHFVKGNSGVLVPQPSHDVHDPLNWSTKWKTLAIIASTSVTFAQSFGPLALAPTFPMYMGEWHVGLPDVIRFTGNTILVLGFSNFLWVPISSAFGRRPALILSNIITLIAVIWRARAQSYTSFMGAAILNGIGAGPSESIQPAIIADMFFLHDRGFWNTLYWATFFSALLLASVINGSISAHYGWRSFWWLNVALVGASLLLVIFCYPETKWNRPTAHGAVTDNNANTTRTKGDIAVKVNEKGSTPLGQGFPSKSQWGIYQPSPDPVKTILKELWTPWKLFAFPIVQFAAFLVSWSCSSFLTVNLTQSQNFAAPPYLFNGQTIGFMNLAVFAGAMIGLASAGPFSDWVSKRLTFRNKGIREPEMRLVAMVPYVIIMYVGNVIVAFGYEHKWHWAPIVLIGYTFAGIQVAALPAMVSTYAVDSYRPVAGPLFVSITVNKNLWGYGLSEFITSWIIKDGYVPPIMTNASLILLFSLLAIPFYFFGKTFRRWSKNSSVHSE